MQMFISGLGWYKMRNCKSAKVSKYKMQKYSSAKVGAKACVKGDNATASASTVVGYWPPIGQLVRQARKTVYQSPKHWIKN